MKIRHAMRRDKSQEQGPEQWPFQYLSFYELTDKTGEFFACEVHYKGVKAQGIARTKDRAFAFAIRNLGEAILSVRGERETA